MKILCTFPGRYGDLLWALPTIRAISRRVGALVHLRIAGEFAAIVPLLQQQPYLASVKALVDWGLHPDRREPLLPDPNGGPYDAVIHLGYRGWPDPDVVRHTLITFNLWSQIEGSKWTKLGLLMESELDLQTPWITTPLPPQSGDALIIAFTEVHFELKLGLTQCVLEYFYRKRGDVPLQYRILTTPSSRWRQETWESWKAIREADWMGFASAIGRGSVVLADCSGAHVLAVAMGIPVVLVEPLEARWNPVFYPLGMDGPQVTVVKGNDGKPTWDARHVADALTRALETRS